MNFQVKAVLPDQYEQWLAGGLKWDATAQEMVATNQKNTPADALAAL